MGLFSFFKKDKYTDGALLISIEGMHCAHCSKRVEDTLLALPGVNKVNVYLEKKTAEVIETEKGALDHSAIRSAVEALGFTVTDIK